MLPFITNATDVPGLGLCLFAAVAVSLGRSADDAPKIREEMHAEVSSRSEWYQENIPEMVPRYNFQKIIEILERKELTAPRNLWFPMPGGGMIIANTYKRPVIFYSPYDPMSRIAFPHFSAFDPEIPPIVLGFVANCHFVSLQIEITPKTQVPTLHFEWPEIHDAVADGWADYLLPNRKLFLKGKRARAKEEDMKNNHPPREDPHYDFTMDSD